MNVQRAIQRLLGLAAVLMSVNAAAASAVAFDKAPTVAARRLGSELIAKGNALYKERRFGEALVAYTQAVDANPNSDVALTNRGIAYASLGPDNYAAARNDFDKATSLNPNNGNAFFSRALLNKRTGQQQAYLDDLNSAARLGHDKAQAQLAAAPAAAAADQQAPPPRAEASAPIAPPAPVAHGGNPVEPLSNGLSFRWERNDIRQRFGEPKPGWVKCEMDYGDFAIHKCYGPGSARVFIHSPRIALNSGISVGSAKSEVARVFGNPFGSTSGPYKLDFQYNGERVAHIKIDWDGAAAESGNPPPPPAHGTAGDAGGLAGIWHCVAPTFSVGGTLHLLPDGTYRMNGGGVAGRYKAANGQVHFDGTLKDWNNGVAKLNNGVMEFQWTNKEGWKQYFAYRR